MALKLTVNGADWTGDVAVDLGVTIDRSLNERATARVAMLNGHVPPRFAEVVIYAADGVTPLFGGLVLDRGTKSAPSPTEYAFVDVGLSGFAAYLDWAYINLTYAAPVLLATVLADLVAALPGASGITLDPGQVAGPLLAAFTWTRMRASDAIRELADRTGYVSQVSPTKALKMFLPGTDAAPTAITDGAPHCLTIDWKDGPLPANFVTVVCGPTGVGETPITHHWVGTGGATYALHGVDVRASSVWPGVVLVNGVSVSLWPAGGGGPNDVEWDWTTDDGTLTFKGTSAATYAVPGADIALTYAPLFPFEVSDASGSLPTILAAPVAYPDVVSYAQAQEIAAGLLAQLDQQPRELDVASLDVGWSEGQALTVAIASRLTGDFVITAVSFALQIEKTGARWLARFSATESATYQGSYLDAWRALTGGAASGLTTVVGGGGGGPASPSVAPRSPIYMGGSYTQSVTSPTTKALIQGAAPYVAKGSWTARLCVNLKARTAGKWVRAVVSDGTLDYGTTLVTSTVFVDVDTLTFPIIDGHTYLVYVLTEAGDGYVGYAQLVEAA